MGGLSNPDNLWKEARRSRVAGRIVAVLAGRMEDRELSLIGPMSRALLKDDIHELIVTDERDAAPGSKVNKIAYLCFFEVSRGGILLVGDRVRIGQKEVGEVIGFDETHMPNHSNIILRARVRRSGKALRLRLGDRLTVRGT
jgi:hypothetical protein